jgi:flagellar motility protein MotE (MotC chaperone)
MNWFLREFRLVPLVLFASVSLLALKVIGIVSGGGYLLHGSAAAQTEPVLLQSVSPLPAGPSPFDVTGSVSAPKAPDKPPEPPAAKPKEPPPAPDGIVVPLDGGRGSPAERAILERLKERRLELEQRARELDTRENLIQAAEKRLEARVAELKDVEARINAAMNKRDEADQARFKSLVTMYESMKPKDAAKIFDRLDRKVLLEVAVLINPRKMSEILSQMSPEAAERLTVEIANRASGGDQAANDLPKIEGRPTAQ